MKNLISILLIITLISCTIITVSADSGSINFDNSGYYEHTNSKITIYYYSKDDPTYNIKEISMTNNNELDKSVTDSYLSMITKLSSCDVSLPITTNNKYSLERLGTEYIDYYGKINGLKSGTLSVVIPFAFNYQLEYVYDNKQYLLDRLTPEDYKVSLYYLKESTDRPIFISADSISYFSGYGLLANFTLSEDDAYFIKTLDTDLTFRIEKTTPFNCSGDFPSDINGQITVNLYTNSFCYKTVYYTQDDSFVNNLTDLISQINDKLGVLNGTADDISIGIARLVAILDSLNGKIDLSTSTLNAIVDNQKQTNDYLNNGLKDDLKESISTSIEQASENEKNEAMLVGDQSVSDVNNAINDVVPLDQYKSALDDFSQSFVSTSTVSVWKFPELYIPAIPALGNKKIPLSVSVDINLSQAYLQYVPETIRIIIGNVLGAALTYYLIKEVMSLTTYMLDNKGGGDVDE